MKHLIGIALAMGLAAAGHADAQGCRSGQRVSSNLGKLLAGSTVCAVAGNEAWQEYHGGGASGGSLVDYKRGPNHPVDPSKTVGSWLVLTGNSGQGTGNDATVVYDYGGAGRISFEVWQPNRQVQRYNFCGLAGQRDVLGAVLMPGSGACPQAAIATTGR